MQAERRPARRPQEVETQGCSKKRMEKVRSIVQTLLFVLLLAGMSLAVTSTPSHAQEPELAKQCVDFSDWKEGEVGTKFVKDNFVFATFRREPLFIRRIDTPNGPGLGLQIAEKGVNVSFPQLASKVVLRIVSGASLPLEITAFNRAGDVVDRVTAPSEQGIIHTVAVRGWDIVDLVIKGGANEGALIEICIEVESERPTEEPLIKGVHPAEGRCGSEITLTVFGDNFKPGTRVFFPDGIETTYTEFISPKELMVKIFIAEDALPGPRSVVISVPELEKAVLKEGFTVICPASGLEARPDLALLKLDWEIIEEDRLLLIAAQVKNVGDAQAPEAIVYVEAQVADWWAAETITPELNSGNSAQVLLELEIPDELRRRSHVFRVGVDPDDEIVEWSDDNNWQAVEVWVPGGQELDVVPLILTVVVVAAITGTTLTVRRSIKVRRRKEWQEKAKEEKPPETCQPCNWHCRKVELKLEPALRKIAHLSLRAYDPVSGKQNKERRVQGEIVDGLNRALTARHQREKPEKLLEQVAPLARALSQQILEWLRSEPATRDVLIVGHLEGGKLTCQFMLYHCKRRGTVSAWEEEDKWKETVRDERDEPVGILRSLDPVEPGVPERLALELTRLLMQFIENV